MPRASSVKPEKKATTQKVPSPSKTAAPAAPAAPKNGAAATRSQLPSATTKREEPKYAPPQPSFLAEHIWFPFYDNLVKLYPKRWTPNGITLFGIFSTVLASVILFSAMPSMMRPIGSEHTQFDAPSDDAVDAATKFLEKHGIEANPPLVTITGNYIAGIRRREIRGNTAGLYGKNIAIVPASVARAATEVLQILRNGAVSTPEPVTDKDGKPLLGRANLYDFERPQLFYKALQVPLGRIEIAVKLAWNSFAEKVREWCPEAHDSIFGNVEKVAASAYAAASDIVIYVSNMIPGVSSTPGRWLLIVGGILNLVYCVADNTDGRHARRTKQSSYVGEYLDHGLDCVTSMMTTYLLGSALGLETSQASVAVLAVAFATVLSHLVNQEKGFLIWGNRAFTVDEAMIAFGVGLIAVGVCPTFISATIPVELLTNIGIPSAWLPPVLTHVRVGELIWFGFLASQVSVVITLLGVDRTVVFRPSSLALIANVAAICYFTNTIGQPTLLRDEAFAVAVNDHNNANSITAAVATLGLQRSGAMRLLDSVLNLIFVYEAQWAILAAFTCSIVIHAPISAKCMKVSVGTNNKPIALALPIALFTFFFISSGIGAGIAVVSHIIQILTNVSKLQKQGEQRAAALKQK